MADAHNGVALIFVLVVLLLLSLAGCGPGGESPDGGGTVPTQVALRLDPQQQAQLTPLVSQIARIEIEVSGPDIAPQTNSISVSNPTSGQSIDLTINAPLGDNRTVRVRAFNSGNILLFSGSESVTLPSSQPIPITVFLPFRVTVNRNGNGTVTSSPPGFPCGANCLDFDHDTPATFTASAGPGSVFTGWSGGGCSGTGSCVVSQTATITATFTAAPNTATLTVSVTGPGTVTSSPGGISCPTACSASFSQGTTVTLTAAPTGGATFAGWGGACSGTSGTTCAVTLNANLNVAATFNAAPSTAVLTVTRTGNGTVTSAPAGISCGSTCSAGFTTGSSVSLTAAPAAGFVFGGWGGACSGTGGCTVTMTGNQTVTATFNPAPPSTATLTVVRAGTGTGTVTSSPGGINCGGDCNQTYPVGTVVTLTATPAAGSTFAGWSGGGCGGTGTCTVTMSANQTVTATFNVAAPTTAVLTLNKAGSGTGTVTSSPGGISCGTGCQSDTGTFTIGTPVTLTATPATGSTFAGWSGGGCSGTGTCVVVMTSNQTVTATFNAAIVLRALTVSKTGSGSGTVTSSPAGISCGAVCTSNFADGTVVTLTATPAAGDTFDSWNGGGGGNNNCDKSPTCTLTMDRTRSISVRFDP